MEKKKVIIIEIFASLLLMGTGLFVCWWSQQLVWILIYPPPLEKQIIEIIPFICWGFSILFIVDALRRTLKMNEGGIAGE
jgi:hypothetical protein